MNRNQSLRWFTIVATILILFGLLYTFVGLRVLPVDRAVLLQWESALYGAIMTGWGVTLVLVGRIAFRRDDHELMKPILCGLAVWLALEALFSAYLRVWFNIGVDIAVLILFAVPLISGMRTPQKP